MGMHKWLRRKAVIFVIIVLVPLLLLHIGGLLETKLFRRSYDECRAVYEDNIGNIFYSNWHKEKELEEDPRIQYYRKEDYHKLTTEERTVFMIGVETFLERRLHLKRKLFSFEMKSFDVDLYRVVMEDFSGNKYYSSWVENQIEVKRRMIDYAEEGYFNLETEERTTRMRKYGVFIVSFYCEVSSSQISSILSLFLVAGKILVFVFFVLLLFNPEIGWHDLWEEFKNLFLGIRDKLLNNSMMRRILGAIGRIFSAIKDLLERIIDYFDIIKRSYRKTKRLFEKAQTEFRAYYRHVMKFLGWEAVKSIVKIFILLVTFAFMFGKLDYLTRAMDKLWPYVIGTLLASILVSIAFAVFLRSIENVDEGLVIEFEKNVGKIKNLGLFFTKIATPRNETIHIPNLMLSMRVIKRLTNLTGEKPYIVHFEVTLSYEIPHGIVSNLYLLAVRDTTDDFEEDFERGRLRKGIECIWGLREDVENKIKDLEKRSSENDEKIKEGIEELEAKTKGGDETLHRLIEGIGGLTEDTKNTIEDLKGTISKNDKKIKKRIEELEAKIKAQLKAVKERLNEGRECIEGLLKDIEDLKERISEDDKIEERTEKLRVQLEAREKSLRELIKGIGRLLKDIEDRIEDLKERFSEDDKIEERTEELKDQLKAQLTAVKERLNEGRGCIEGLLKDIEDLKERISENDKIKKRIKELNEQLETTEDRSPYIIIEKLDRHTVNYEFHVFTDHPYHLLKIKHYLMKNIKRRFDEFGIEIMSPSQVSRRQFVETRR